MTRAVATGIAAAIAVAACASPPERGDPYASRSVWLADLAAARRRPLTLRFNPATCRCPPFEALIGERWLRAQLVGDPALPGWTDQLARAPIERLPIAVAVDGALGSDLWRTEAGLYAVQVKVDAIVDPPAEAAAPAAPAP